VRVADSDDRVRWGMGDALVGTVLVLLVPALVVAIALGIAGVTDTQDIALWAAALLQIPLWVGLLGVPLWATHRKGRRSLAADFGLAFRWSDLPLGLGVGLGAQLGLGVVLVPLYHLIGVDPDKVGKAAEDLADRAHDPFGVVCLVVIAVLAAPVFEELFYRGLWLRSAERRWGTPAAVVVSSLVFALMHFQWVDTIALAAFGGVAAVLAVRTGRLGPGIVAHMAFNLTAVISLLRG
jgi:membrane protease YdiL (CAAX protease family)